MPKASPPTRKPAKPVAMTYDELMDLPVSVDLVTAGRAFSIGRTKAHELARNGEFPCRVLRLGNQYRVPRMEIFRALGIETAPVALDETA